MKIIGKSLISNNGPGRVIVSFGTGSNTTTSWKNMSSNYWNEYFIEVTTTTLSSDTIIIRYPGFYWIRTGFYIGRNGSGNVVYANERVLVNNSAKVTYSNKTGVTGGEQHNLGYLTNGTTIKVQLQNIDTTTTCAGHFWLMYSDDVGPA